MDEYLETSQPNIWAFGDANGKYLFKHVGNYESGIVYQNAILKEKVKADYHAVPHAVFSYPEIAGVGMGEQEAVEKYGKDRVVIGLKFYEDTAKGRVMGIKDYFVKIILDAEEEKNPRCPYNRTSSLSPSPPNNSSHVHGIKERKTNHAQYGYSPFPE